MKIPQRYWAYLGLLVWGGLGFLALHKTTYGVEEGAAHALLLVWSVADNVVSPIVTLGVPDFRALFLIPVGVLWTGSVVAAKVATLLVVAGVAWMLHAWRRAQGEEAALIATGLWLLSPLLLVQIDTIAVAPFLLAVFLLGAWMERSYREAPQAFGARYFAQLFLCLVSVTLHPAGLAYPLLLLWTWYKNPVQLKQQHAFYAGITFAVVLAIFLTFGWQHVAWFGNPLAGFALQLFDLSPASFMGMVSGVLVLMVVCGVLWKAWAEIRADFLGQVLLAALLMSALNGDGVFSALALVLCFYWGVPLLLPQGDALKGGFLQQRGLVLSVFFVIATASMLSDRAYYQAALGNELQPRDGLIRGLVMSGGFLDGGAGGRVASQWPALTMLACRCDALPLPPNVSDSDALLAMLRGIRYVMFDPHDLRNAALVRNLATAGSDKVETIDLQTGGVVVEIKAAAAVSNVQGK